MQGKTTNLTTKKLIKKTVQEFPRKRGYVISIANGQGGIGKSTISGLLAYNLAEMGIKTLVIDACVQANVSKTMLLTKGLVEDVPADLIINQSFMQGLIKKNLEGSIIPIMDNLDLIPSSRDTKNFARNYHMNFKNHIDRDYFLDDSVRKIQFFYDVIIIDSPSGNIEINRNIALASDYIIVAYHPTGHSINSLEALKSDLDKLKEDYIHGVKFQVLGILASKVDRTSRMDRKLLHNLVYESKDYTEDDVFEPILYLTETVKKFDIMGITNNSKEDQYIHGKYNEVIVEMLKRINDYETVVHMNE